MILDKPIRWRRETSQRTDLTPEEQTNVRKALDVLRVRLGGAQALAKALGVTFRRLDNWLRKVGRPNAAAALYASRVAGVSVEDILTGRFPVAGACPLCGRTDVTEAP
jgi:hypothetical protein